MQVKIKKRLDKKVDAVMYTSGIGCTESKKFAFKSATECSLVSLVRFLTRLSTFSFDIRSSDMRVGSSKPE
jgi:hypothetical protein